MCVKAAFDEDMIVPSYVRIRGNVEVFQPNGVVFFWENEAFGVAIVNRGMLARA